MLFIDKAVTAKLEVSTCISKRDKLIELFHIVAVTGSGCALGNQKLS